jgi:hypothetical protein
MADTRDRSGSLGWRAARQLIRWRFRLAVDQVLTARRIEMTNGMHERWLKGEIADLIGHIEAQAGEMRKLAELETLPTAGKRLMVELAIYTAAAYRALLEMGVSEQAARATLADLGWIVYAAMLRLASLPFRLVSRDPGKRLRWTIRSLLRFPFNAPGPPGYEVETRREGDDILTYFRRCPPQSFVRKLIAETGDKGDLEVFYQSWCLYDWPGADVIAGDGRRGHYERRRTLSRGDPVCDMCWKENAKKGASAHV